MINKYYTPQISEFYTGFEFEMLVMKSTHMHKEPIEVWEKGVWGKKNQIYDLLRGMAIQEEKDILAKVEDILAVHFIQVKALEQKDIEDLGYWEDYDDTEGNVWFRNDDTKWRICLSEHTAHNIWIVDDEDPSLDDTVFKGIIKNKSALIQVLQMVGVE